MKNQIIKAALFDLDGVVVFTDKYHYLAWKRLCDEKGWDFNEQVNNRLRGIPRINSLEEILKHNNTDLPHKEKVRLADIKNTYYVELLQELNEGDIYTGSVEFIKALRNKNVKIALCSSSKNAPFVLDKLGIAQLFDAVVTGADIVNAKPDPEIFLKGADWLGVPPQHCVVFEDSLVGIKGAIAGKMKSVGVGNREETEELAGQFISDYSEIDIDTFVESGKIKRMPIDENAIVEDCFIKSELAHNESLFSLGNGYLGVRGTYSHREANELCGTYINGSFANIKYKHLIKFKGYAEKNEVTVNLPDWRIVELIVDGERASFENENIENSCRRLDFKTGQLVHGYIFATASGKKARVEALRLVNRQNVHGAEAALKVTPLNFNGEIVLKSVVVKRAPTRSSLDFTRVKESYISNGIFSELITIPSSNQRVALSVAHRVAGDCKYSVSETNGEDEYIYTVNATVECKKSVQIQKYAAFAATIDGFDHPLDYTRELAENNANAGLEAFVQEQKDFWDEHWKNGDIIISGNSADQQAVRYSLFQLRQQLSTVNQCSIGATGLSGPGYSGQVFWDTEMYLMPYYNFTSPETQKELLMYRYRILDKARARAKEFDTVGAMYAWCSIDGEETSVVFEASTAEYHINSDISFAIWRYVDTTEDCDFLYDYGAEIVFETAKFMSHRGTFSEARGGKFCINAVCGPDEYACGVNNNFYTNMMVKWHLEYALGVVEDMQKNAPQKFAELSAKINLTPEDFELWKKAADNMYYRYNEQYGIYEQDDSYLYEDAVDMSKIPMNCDLRGFYHPLDLWRLQVSKQADVVLSNFIHGEHFTREEKLRCYDYYEPRCNHGSSLSPAIYSIMAAELGKPEAYEFFRLAAYMDINDFKRNTGSGVHIACLGGVWMTVVNGFLGLRHYEDGILINPVIPSQWQSYKTRLAYKNSVISAEVDRLGFKLTLISGEKLRLTVGEEQIELSKNAPIFTSKNVQLL